MLAKDTLLKWKHYLTVNASVTVLVSLTDHLINLVVSQLLSDGGHDVTELSGRDEAVVVTIEDLDPTV